MKHQNVSCKGNLFHWEHAGHDHYKCEKCGKAWIKKKRQPAAKSVASPSH